MIQCISLSFIADISPSKLIAHGLIASQESLLSLLCLQINMTYKACYESIIFVDFAVIILTKSSTNFFPHMLKVLQLLVR